MNDNIKKAAEEKYPISAGQITSGDVSQILSRDSFIAGATSEAAREYWEKKLLPGVKEAINAIDKIQDSINDETLILQLSCVKECLTEPQPPKTV